MTCLGVGAKDSITGAEKTKTKAADKGREEPQPLIVLLAFLSNSVSHFLCRVYTVSDVYRVSLPNIMEIDG
jgi:hypothetical protein